MRVMTRKGAAVGDHPVPSPLDKAGIIVRAKYYYSGTVEFYSLVFTTK